MNTQTREKLERVQELLTQLSEIETELEGLLGSSAAPTFGKAKPTPGAATKKYRCSSCGKLGHSRKTCGDEPEIEVAGTAKPGAKGGRHCSICKLPGHQARTCVRVPANALVSPALGAKKPILDDEADLADAIKDEWVENDRSSLDVCKDLGISMARFNAIITKYEITKHKEEVYGNGA